MRSFTLLLLFLRSKAQVQPSTFTAPGAFPTSLFSSYYNNPTATASQVQPVVSDPVTNTIYPETLTDPLDLPLNNTVDPHPLPPTASESLLLAQAISQIQSIADSPKFGTNTCTQCLSTLVVAKFLSMAAPSQGPALFVFLCTLFNLSPTCSTTYARTGLGAVLTQVLANADAAGLDGELFCQNFIGICPLPPTTPLNLTGWFAKPKPNPLPKPKKSSGKRLKVLHISDLHLDPRECSSLHKSLVDWIELILL